MPPDLQDSRGSSSRRSKAGCIPCRQTRIKCDEVHPKCGRCSSRSLQCQWPSLATGQKHTNPRSFTSCDGCRQRKTRCQASEDSNSCLVCKQRGEVCRWPSREVRSMESVLPTLPGLDANVTPSSTISASSHITTNDVFATLPSAVRDVTGLSVSSTGTYNEPSDLKDLISLYFSSVHQFAYLTFIHEVEFLEQLHQNRAPEGLTLLMAAHALRFGGRQYEPERLNQADEWVKRSGDSLIARVFAEFGAVDLMELVLCQTYDFLNGHYSRGIVMAGMAARMMTFLRLHELDERSHQAAKPLLGKESLRRLAWSVWFLDATLDGGLFGASTIQEDSFTIQLPMEHRSFLLQQQIPTEQLVPTTLNESGSTNLDISAHLIRTMAARQCLAQTQSRIQRGLIQLDSIVNEAARAETKSAALLQSFPAELTYSRGLYHIYRDRRSALVLLHIGRINCERHRSLLRLTVYQRTSTGVGDGDQEREILIASAKKVSQILADALDYDVALDPQIAMHAYNGIETLLFQPTRHAGHRPEVFGSRQAVLAAFRPLLQVIRSLSKVCKLVSLIYPEIVNRMVQMGYVDELIDEDIMAVLQKIHYMTESDKEFDWTDSFWRYEVFLSRRSKQAAPRVPAVQDRPNPSNHAGESPDDVLLDAPGTSSEINDAEYLQPVPTTSRNEWSVFDDQEATFGVLPNTGGPAGQAPSLNESSQLHAGPMSRLHELFAPGGPRGGALPETIAAGAFPAGDQQTMLSQDPGALSSFLLFDGIYGVPADVAPLTAMNSPSGHDFPFPWG